MIVNLTASARVVPLTALLLSACVSESAYDKQMSGTRSWRRSGRPTAVKSTAPATRKDNLTGRAVFLCWQRGPVLRACRERLQSQPAADRIDRHDAAKRRSRSEHQRHNLFVFGGAYYRPFYSGSSVIYEVVAKPA